MPAADGAFSWNSELPSGHSPFWIRDEALSALGFHSGDAVTVDTSAEPRDGDLVVAEVEVEGDSLRLARRYFSAGSQVRLEPVGEVTDDTAALELDDSAVIIMGVIKGRLRLTTDDPPEEELLS
jgi:SOS-response transcriptional repressor LexA